VEAEIFFFARKMVSYSVGDIRGILGGAVDISGDSKPTELFKNAAGMSS
jgi:hypothetical protein